MKRIKLVVAYDGTRYSGWQLQPNGETVEGVLNRALSELLNETIRVTGASRTDAGVHSLGNVAIFDTETRLPPEKLSYALNQRLPEDIVVQDSCEVPEDWHPRRCSSRKTYEYRILCAKFPNPQRRLDTHFTYHALQADAMQTAASFLEGTHDFKSFCSIHTQAEDTVRTIYSCQVQEQENVITIRINGSGFLYNMVRIIAGTLIQVGTGRLAPEAIPAILAAEDRSAAGPTAPANGLTMIGISYDEEPWKQLHL